MGINTVTTVLGIDFGLRRTGIAVGRIMPNDSFTATPLTTIGSAQGRPVWAEFDKLIETWHPDAFVVGMPNGLLETQPLNKGLKKFCQSLKTQYELPVYLEDEAFSSVEAQYQLKTQRKTGRRKKKVSKHEIDQLAAAIILESWIRTHISKETGIAV